MYTDKIFPKYEVIFTDRRQTAEFRTNVRKLNPDDNKYYLIGVVKRFELPSPLKLVDSAENPVDIFLRDVYNVIMFYKIDPSVLDAKDFKPLLELDPDQRSEHERMFGNLINNR